MNEPDSGGAGSRPQALALVSGGPASALCVAFAARRSAPPVLLHLRRSGAPEDSSELLASLASRYGSELLVRRGPWSVPVRGVWPRPTDGQLLAVAEQVAAARGITRVYTGSRRDGMPRASAVEVRAPVAGWPLRRVISEAIRVGVPLRWTCSCENSAAVPCGECRGCIERASEFAACGALDPTVVADRYQSHASDLPTPTLVYVAGMPYSGSTLLSLLLGGHPGVFAAGEFCEFGDDARARALCSCGVRLDVCGFWGIVLEGFGDLMPLTTSHELAGGAPDPDTSVRALHEAGRHAGASVVVDSTKRAEWCERLLAVHTGLRVIHLIRDGRAAITSFRKRAGPDASAAAIATRWRETHEACEAIAEVLGDGCLEVHYEDLVTRPRVELERVFAWLGLEPCDAVFDYETAESHQIRGNPMRYDRRPIAVDDRWRSELSTADLDAFERVAGQLARRHGYETRRTPHPCPHRPHDG